MESQGSISSDDEGDYLVRRQPPTLPVQEAEVPMEQSSEEEDGPERERSPSPLPEPDIRRTARQMAGTHKNPFHLPVSATQQETLMAQGNANLPLDPKVLADISATQLLLVKGD